MPALPLPNDPPQPSSRPKPKAPQHRLAGADREARLLRIYACLQKGLAHSEIAAREGVSRERMRQIVAAARVRRRARDEPEHAMQIARLASALRAAIADATRSANAAASATLAALDRLDRCFNQMRAYRSLSIDALGAGDQRRLAQRAAALDDLLNGGQDGTPGKSARGYVDLHDPFFAAMDGPISNTSMSAPRPEAGGATPSLPGLFAQAPEARPMRDHHL